jgi:transposase
VPRAKLVQMLSSRALCTVAMEGYATSHSWGCVAHGSGHDVQLVLPIDVKPFARQKKNDTADTVAITEAVLRPTIHFVSVKSAEHQARAVAFRKHQCLIWQRTQLISALGDYLAEFGIVVAQGPLLLREAIGLLESDGTELPAAVKEIASLYLDQIDVLGRQMEAFASTLRLASEEHVETRRLCTVPGVGPVTLDAIMAFAPDLRTFASGRNFAARLGLVPRQRSTGCKTRHGGFSKLGQTDIRKLLILAAMSRIRWIIRKGVVPDNRLGRTVARKPRMVEAVALANTMARNIWAMMTRE